MNKPISRRALFIKQQSIEVNTKNMIIKYVGEVWDFTSGPFENIFRLIPYAAIPLLGSIGSVVSSLLVMAATRILKIHPADFGAEIDKYFGLGPNSDPLSITEADFEKGVNEILGISNYAKSSSNNSISKRAFGVGSVARVLWWMMRKSIPMLASVFVFSHLGNFTEEHLGIARETIGEKIDPIKRTKDFISEQTSLPADNSTVVKKEKTLSDINTKDEMISYIEKKYGPTGAKK